MIKKNDVLLLAGILAAGVIALVFGAVNAEPGYTVKVVSGHEIYGVYSLLSDGEERIEIGGCLNVFSVEGGAVRMKEANCPNGDCLRQQSITGVGQTIACLPNRILLSIEGDRVGALDSIAY